MIDNAKVLAKILFISFFTMMYLNRSVRPIVGEATFRNWMFSWAALTSVSFLAPKILILFIGAAVILWFLSKRLENKIALFYAVIFVIPAYELQTVVINLNYQKIVSIVLLVPLVISGFMNKQSGAKPPGHVADYFVALYLILLFILKTRGIDSKNVEGFYMTYPAVIKYGMSLLLQYYLPYIVARKYIRSYDQLKTVLIAFVCSGFLIAPIAFFEILTSNMLYVTIPYNLGIDWALSGVTRDGMLRAMASIQHPLFLGMIMMMSLALFHYVKQYIKDPKLVMVGYGILGAGLLASLSRGPWTATALMFFVIFVLSPNKLRNILLTSALLVVALAGLAMAGYWEKVVSYIPFVGDLETGNVDYRFMLFEQSLVVIGEFPFFGTYDPRLHEALLPLLQGQGIVDLVNVYLAIAMSSGLTGFFLFLGVILFVMFGLLKALLMQQDKHSPMYCAGVAIFSALFGMFFVLSMVSDANIVGVIFFGISGIAISYNRIVRETKTKELEERIKALPTDRVHAAA